MNYVKVEIIDLPDLYDLMHLAFKNFDQIKRIVINEETQFITVLVKGREYQFYITDSKEFYGNEIICYTEEVNGKTVYYIQDRVLGDVSKILLPLFVPNDIIANVIKLESSDIKLEVKLSIMCPREDIVKTHYDILEKMKNLMNDNFNDDLIKVGDINLIVK